MPFFFSACGGNYDLLNLTSEVSISAPPTAVVSALSNCSWTLTNKKFPTSIILNVTGVDIEKSADCSKDKLIVRLDGQERQLCNMAEKVDLVARSHVEIQFAVDSSVERNRSFEFFISRKNLASSCYASSSK